MLELDQDTGAHDDFARAQVREDALDRGALNDTESRRPVESHMEPAALAEHHRRAPAQDHARVSVGEVPDALFAVAAEVRFVVVGRRRSGTP